MQDINFSSKEFELNHVYILMLRHMVRFAFTYTARSYVIESIEYFSWQQKPNDTIWILCHFPDIETYNEGHVDI